MNFLLAEDCNFAYYLIAYYLIAYYLIQSHCLLSNSIQIIETDIELSMQTKRRFCVRFFERPRKQFL